jgi:hypothetical protein
MGVLILGKTLRWNNKTPNSTSRQDSHNVLTKTPNAPLRQNRNSLFLFPPWTCPLQFIGDFSPLAFKKLI